MIPSTLRSIPPTKAVVDLGVVAVVERLAEQEADHRHLEMAVGKVVF